MSSPTKRRRLSSRRSIAAPARRNTTLVASDAPVPNSPATERLLAKLSKETLARLAKEWLDEADTKPNENGRKRAREDSSEEESGQSTSDEDEDDEDAQEKVTRQRRRLTMCYSNVDSLKKPAVLNRILHDWRRGLTPSQIADVDVASFVEKPNKGRKWTAHELVYVPAASSSSPAKRVGMGMVGTRELERRLEEALEPLFAACHVQVSKPYEGDSSPFHIRLALFSSSSVTASPAGTNSPVVHILHFPSTPYLLLPALNASLSPLITQALCTAFSRSLGRRTLASTAGGPQGVVEELRKLKLAGSDWSALREMLIENKEGASGGSWKKFRKEEGEKLPDGEDGDALAPKERRRSVDLDDTKGLDYVAPHEASRIIMDDFELKEARDKEVGAVFGRKPLPTMEKVEWQIPLSSLLGEEDIKAANLDDADLSFSYKITGPSVFEHLRSLVEDGLAEEAEDGQDAAKTEREVIRCGLPEWMTGAMHGAETVVEMEYVNDGEGEPEIEQDDG